MAWKKIAEPVFLVLLFIIIAVGGIFTVKYLSEPTRTSTLSVFTKEVRLVSYIGVLDGDEFDVRLRDQTRIRCQLRVDTVPQAKDKVIRFINNSTNPRVVIFDHDSETNVWEVDILLDASGSAIGDTSLTLWLIEEDLVWESSLPR